MENASERRKEDPFALEETTARTISEAERPKFLMFDSERFRRSLRNFGRAQEIVRLFLHRRDLFCAFLDLAKNAPPFSGRIKNPLSKQHRTAVIVIIPHKWPTEIRSPVSMTALQSRWLVPR